MILENSALLEQTQAAPELTILMPCLNEAETLAACIGKAQAFLQRSGTHGEVLVADNGSTDGSPEIAQGLDARVIPIRERGYGAAFLWQGRFTFRLLQDRRSLARFSLFANVAVAASLLTVMCASLLNARYVFTPNSR